jgi:hypothetical protein
MMEMELETKMIAAEEYSKGELERLSPPPPQTSLPQSERNPIPATKTDQSGCTCIVTADCTYQLKITERHKVFGRTYDLHACMPRSSHLHVHGIDLDVIKLSEALHRYLNDCRPCTARNLFFFIR